MKISVHLFCDRPSRVQSALEESHLTSKSLNFSSLTIHSATLRRGFAFSTSINNSKNPPLVKSRNVTSQSFNYPQQTSAAAGSATTVQQQQAPPTSQIQVVYEQSQTSSKTDATLSTNRPEIENARSET